MKWPYQVIQVCVICILTIGALAFTFDLLGIRSCVMASVPTINLFASGSSLVLPCYSGSHNMLGGGPVDGLFGPFILLALFGSHMGRRFVNKESDRVPG